MTDYSLKQSLGKLRHSKTFKFWKESPEGLGNEYHGSHLQKLLRAFVFMLCYNKIFSY